MRSKINICYIDDRLNRDIERYLDQLCAFLNSKKNSLQNIGFYENNTEENEITSFFNKVEIYKDYEFQFDSYKFEPEDDDYKTLLSNEMVSRANIIVIDSWLFENENSPLSKFTGEQFKIILRQVFPFIKTIVISQNGGKANSLTVEKWKGNGSSIEHYHKQLLPVLIRYILATIEEHKVLDQLTMENEVDEVLIGTIQNTISGIVDTALFEKQDLDELIKLFREVKNYYGK
ncbi:hypothetical protein ACVNNN_19990 [Lysinibacillus fusiformis]|uniref:hypothetical protein n=1 Tax=Lysinibacillus sp. PWR01 TaxID=3342384 RepID=UPI00372D45CC